MLTSAQAYTTMLRLGYPTQLYQVISLTCQLASTMQMKAILDHIPFLPMHPLKVGFKAMVTAMSL